MSTYPSCKHDFSDPMGVCPLCEQENKIESLEQQLASAHREGWEQAKREAAHITDVFSADIGTCCRFTAQEIQNAIAAMEYGGKANDR